MLAFLSGILACILLNANLARVDTPFINNLLQDFLIISILFTAFALAGVANAFNIINGFNGLASDITLIVFTAYFIVSLLVKGKFLTILDLTVIGAVLGFFIWNFP